MQASFGVLGEERELVLDADLRREVTGRGGVEGPLEAEPDVDGVAGPGGEDGGDHAGTVVVVSEASGDGRRWARPSGDGVVRSPRPRP